MRRTSITLIYAIEAAGSRRPRGVMVSVFFCVLLVCLLLVGYGILVVGSECILLLPKVRTIYSLILVRL